MSDRVLGCMSFVTTPVPHNVCGSNGLPLTPNSIKVLGLAQDLLNLKHENLCKYVDFKCGKHDRIFAVAEHYLQNLHLKMTSSISITNSEWYDFCFQVTTGILTGLDYLNKYDIIHLCLEPKNILLTSQNKPKLSCFGMYHMTEGGSLVSHPIGKPNYSSPEHLISLSNSEFNAISFKSDSWSVAVILLELLHREFLWKNEDVDVVIAKVLKLCNCSSAQTVLQNLVQHFKVPSIILQRDDSLSKLCRIFDHAFAIEQQYRMTPSQLLQVLRSDETGVGEENDPLIGFDFNNTDDVNVNPLNDMDCDEMWYLWNLAGGDMISDALKSVTTTSSVKKLPLFGTSSGEVLGMESSPETLFDSTITVLSMDTVDKRLVVTEDNINFMYPLLELDGAAETDDETSKLPINIKENAFEYQVYRIALFKRLLQAYPFLRERLWKEARVDIPPFYRGKVWAGLLDVTGNIDEQYLQLDKESPIITDRQIAVDIPRCHQYNSILSSPVAHHKLKRVLKAWLMAHPHLSYWQGLDSLCAVFVHLNFNDEPTAFASLSAFIEKYLHKFFMKDNSATIQEYLKSFSHLITFHDPVLSNHLNEINFIPDLYAIPWFLTMFAHVFPLHKVVHLWDTLLLGNSSFPLCIGVAVLQQLRSQLLQSDFNECILLFSDLPEVNIDAVVEKSIQIFCQTPKSATYRTHAQQNNKTKREPVSYYTDDYNSIPKSELSNMSIPLEDLKREICCRISAEDLIQLCELRGSNDSKTPAKVSKNSKPRICVIDVRSSDEFGRGSIPTSLNYPYPNKSSSTFVKTVVQLKSKVTVVAGNQSSRDDRLFASELIKTGLKGVCVLHGGIDILKPTGILTIPS